MKLLRIFTPVCLSFLSLAAAAWAADAPAPDIASAPSCRFCGMDRAKYARSRMLVAYSDAVSVATCSIHCLAVDMALAIDRAPVSIQVGDQPSGALLDAEKAVWVIQDGKPGVMTRRGKWAFADEAAARVFIAAEGGRLLAGFDEALQASFEDMAADVKAIRERRAARRAAQEKEKEKNK